MFYIYKSETKIFGPPKAGNSVAALKQTICFKTSRKYNKVPDFLSHMDCTIVEAKSTLGNATDDLIASN